MKLTLQEKDRISSGDVKFLGEVLRKELEDITDKLMVYKDSKGMDDLLKGRASIVIEILKVLES